MKLKYGKHAVYVRDMYDMRFYGSCWIFSSTSIIHPDPTVTIVSHDSLASTVVKELVREA